HNLPVLCDVKVHQRITVTQPKHEVSQVVAAEIAGVDIIAIQRIYVLNLGMNSLILVSSLERMLSDNARIVNLWIIDVGILPLRIGRLPPEIGISRNILLRESTGKSRILR